MGHYDSYFNVDKKEVFHGNQLSSDILKSSNDDVDGIDAFLTQVFDILGWSEEDHIRVENDSAQGRGLYEKYADFINCSPLANSVEGSISNKEGNSMSGTNNNSWCDICGREVCVCYAYFAQKAEEAAVSEVVSVGEAIKCSGFTKAGAACKNNVKKGFDFCGPHQDQVQNKTLVAPVEESAEAPVAMEDEKIIPNMEEVIEIPGYEERPVYGATPIVPEVIERSQATPEPDLFIIAGTGSRSVQNASSEGKKALTTWLTARLTKAKDKYGDSLVIMSGMAEGFDKALALTALKLDIKLWCALPSGDYGTYYWGKQSMTGRDQTALFSDIITKAWRVTEVMPTPKGTNNKYGGANLDRNTFMVDQANAFLVYDPSSVGTSHCFAAIKKANKPHQIVPMVK